MFGGSKTTSNSHCCKVYPQHKKLQHVKGQEIFQRSDEDKIGLLTCSRLRNDLSQKNEMTTRYLNKCCHVSGKLESGKAFNTYYFNAY